MLRAVFAFLLVVAVSADRFTVKVLHSNNIHGSEGPKILSVTLSPPGPRLLGTEVTATARINSPLEEPVLRWTIFDITRPDRGKKFLEYVLIKISENEYECIVSFGRIRRWNEVHLDVSNSYGKESKQIELDIVATIGQFCRISEQCLLASNNSECDPEKKVCFCQPGYGINYDDTEDKTCKKYPFRRVKNMQVEQGIDMDCRVSIPNVSEINWFRNGILCASGSRCSQDSQIRYDEEAFTYQRRLWLINGIMESATYICQVTTTDGKILTVAENELVLVPKFEKTYYLTSGSNQTVLCELRWSSYETRLVRDGKDICTPDASWCSKHNEWYDLLNLRANHTFTCEAISDFEKPATVIVYHFIINKSETRV